MTKFTGLRALALAALIPTTLVLAACSAAAAPGTGSSDSPAEPVKVRIGVSEIGPIQDVLKTVASENNVEIEWQAFSDWTLPNEALVNGDIDANAFQHIAFLSAFNVAKDADVQPVGPTQITTWGLYSENYDAVADLPAGAKIAIPNDPSNGARALFLLREAGLIELGSDIGIYPTTDDITKNSRNIEILPVVAQQLPTTYPDVDAVVVGAATIDKALSITSDKALLLDDPHADTSLPYTNVLAVRGEDKDKKEWADIVAFWQDPRVAEALKTESKGNSVVATVPVEKLRSTLSELEKLAEDIKN